MAFGWYHTKRRWRTYCLVLMILSFVMLFTATIFLQQDVKEFATLGNFDSLQDIQEFINMVNSTYNAVRIHNSLRERVVLEDGSHIAVADMLLDDNDPERENVNALRVIETLEVEGVHSAFRLILPSELSKRNIDSSRWKVDRSYIQPNTYYHICAETIFYCDALNFSRESDGNVLLLGLGGGIMDCFLHYHFPKLNITVVEISAQMVYVAYKWFNFEQDNHHHLVIADGVEFVKQQALKGETWGSLDSQQMEQTFCQIIQFYVALLFAEFLQYTECPKSVQYDAIILDACYSKSLHKTLCPTDSFLKKSSARYLSNLVSDKGIIVINAVPGTITVSEECELVLHSFSKYFHYCNTRNTTGENEVVYCMHRPTVLEKHINLLSVMKSST